MACRDYTAQVHGQGSSHIYIGYRNQGLFLIVSESKVRVRVPADVGGNLEADEEAVGNLTERGVGRL